MFQKLKNFLEMFLPPPTKAFNREIERVISAVKEQGVATEKQEQAITKQEQAITKQEQAITKQEQAIQHQTKYIQQLEKKIVELEQNSREHLDDIHKKEFTKLKKIDSIYLQNQRLEEGLIRTIKQPKLSYFVLNVVDHCNLKCQCCDHFACIAEEKCVSIEAIEHDLSKMSTLIGGSLIRMGIMGGEPLLHPKLIEIMVISRKYFPNTLLQVVTNGLLLLKQTDEFWDCCRENNVMIVNTKYPINQDYEGMIETAKKKSVKFEFYGNTDTTLKTSYKAPLDLEGRQDANKSFLYCKHSNSLPFLMEGKFYACTVCPNIGHFNKKFDQNLQIETGDYLVLDEVKDQEEIFQFLSSPKPFCRYCKTDKRYRGIPWEQSKKTIDEWLE